MPAPRALVLGFEVGDGRLIRDWALDGSLPTFASLARRGQWRWLDTTARALHVSAWPSLYTGAPPGEHGVYYTFQPAPGEQGYRRFGPGQYGRPTFWQLLDQAGRRCAVFDAPYTHAEAGYRGAQVFDWATWARYGEPGSTPSELLRQLQRRFGGAPLDLEAHDIGLIALDADEMVKKLCEAIRVKGEAACWLAQQVSWDLFFTVFGETHPAAHYCWSAGDQGRLREVYRALDRALAGLLDVVGPDTTVFAVSGDAVGPNHSGWHLLPQVLEKLGALVPAQRAGPGAAGGGAAQRRDPVKVIRDLFPKDLRKALARQLPRGLRDRLAKRVDTADIDWSRTRAYWLPTDLEGYVRINLKGREPLGIVEPGAEYEALCSRLCASLAQLVNPATGKPAVAEVLRSDRAFPGARRDWLPDLIVVWQSAAPIEALASDEIGRVEAPSPDGRVGTHDVPGFALSCGPGVAARAAPTQGHIFDLAPTLLRLLDAPVPAYMVGSAWSTLPSD